RWLEAADLQQELYRHLAQYVPRILCVGGWAASSREEHREEQREDLAVQLLLLAPLEWLLLGEEPSSGLALLQENNQPSPLCGHVFRVGEPTYSCRECAADPTCVLCMQCFLGSTLKPGREDLTAGNTHLQTHTLRRCVCLFSVLLQYSVEMLTWDQEETLPAGLKPPEWADTYLCMLFNDEVHTYEQVIYTLQKAVSCSQKEAVSFATTGRKSRNTSRQSKPLRVQVMHSSVVAHQCFALRALSWMGNIIQYSDGLRRTLCQVCLQKLPEGQFSSLVDKLMLNDSKMWKGARNVYHQLLMNSLLMDLKYKKVFAIQFAKNYRRLQTDFMEDDHERVVSVTSLSVQLFTVPTMARMLMVEQDLMTTIIRTFVDHLRHRDLQGRFQFDRYTAQQAFKFGRVQSLIGDLK
ncbi:hypothetical protein JOQ06_028062, partial [Pogonophryne albipinna]